MAVATLRRWLSRPDFLALYRQARRQTVEQAIARLQQVTNDAVATLEGCLHAESESVRLRAAVAILDQAFRGTELLDLEERVAYLEEAAGQ